MTREEAIEVIEQDIPCEHDIDLIEALEMAIQALDNENVLERIRAEIEKVFCMSVVTNELRTPMEVKADVLQIIDKYKGDKE